MNPEMIPELVEQIRKECYETGYAAAIEDAVQVALNSKPRMAVPQEWYGIEKIIAKNIKALLHEAKPNLSQAKRLEPKAKRGSR